MKPSDSTTNLVSLLDFIDRLAVDDKLYWRFESESSGAHELTWHRNSAPRSWSLKTQAVEKNASLHDSASLIRALSSTDLDLAVIERQIGATILMQAVYADLVVQGAVQLFGAEAVESSREGMRQFLGQVQETAEKLTAQPKLKLISRT